MSNKEKIKVVFLGNHTVGVFVLKAIMQEADLIGIVAHPKDNEDGIIYESVFDFARNNNIRVIRSTGQSEIIFDFIKSLKPDLIWITDFRYIIPQKIIELPKIGTVNIHPSLLPRYRGRAAINWALINGESEFGLSVHYVDTGVDTGDIIVQERIEITETDYISDLLIKCYPIYFKITKKVLSMFSNNQIVRIPQIGEPSIFPARTAKDGQIDWNNSGDQILNLIRAVSKPYPGARSTINSNTILIWRAVFCKSTIIEDLPNGTVMSIESQKIPKVKCKDGFLLLKEYEIISSSTISLKVGNLLL